MILASKFIENMKNKGKYDCSKYDQKVVKRNHDIPVKHIQMKQSDKFLTLDKILAGCFKNNNDVTNLNLLIEILGNDFTPNIIDNCYFSSNRTLLMNAVYQREYNKVEILSKYPNIDIEHEILFDLLAHGRMYLRRNMKFQIMKSPLYIACSWISDDNVSTIDRNIKTIEKLLEIEHINVNLRPNGYHFIFDVYHELVANFEDNEMHCLQDIMLPILNDRRFKLENVDIQKISKTLDCMEEIVSDDTRELRMKLISLSGNITKNIFYFQDFLDDEDIGVLTNDINFTLNLDYTIECLRYDDLRILTMLENQENFDEFLIKNKDLLLTSDDRDLVNYVKQRI